MRVFVTGGTGWVGSVVVDELRRGGHQVCGLARSEEKAKGLIAKGAEVMHGTLDDLDRLAAAAADADAIITSPSTTTFHYMPRTASRTAARSLRWARR